jgi:hypothetical protein
MRGGFGSRICEFVGCMRRCRQKHTFFSPADRRSNADSILSVHESFARVLVPGSNLRVAEQPAGTQRWAVPPRARRRRDEGCHRSSVHYLPPSSLARAQRHPSASSDRHACTQLLLQSPCGRMHALWLRIYCSARLCVLP